MPEWAFVFLGIIAIVVVLLIAYLIIRKLFGKKRHGDKNKSKGFKSLFSKGGDLMAGKDVMGGVSYLASLNKNFPVLFDHSDS